MDYETFDKTHVGWIKYSSWKKILTIKINVPKPLIVLETPIPFTAPFTDGWNYNYYYYLMIFFLDINIQHMKISNQDKLQKKGCVMCIPFSMQHYVQSYERTWSATEPCFKHNHDSIIAMM